jgi:hypothetical protein
MKSSRQLPLQPLNGNFKFRTWNHGLASAPLIPEVAYGQAAGACKLRKCAHQNLIPSLCLGLQRSEKPWHELVHPKYFFATLDHHGVAAP